MADPPEPIDRIRAEARTVLERAWDDYRGYCFPHPDTYPHLWLWDSCFHAIAWGALGDRRGLRELQHVFASQLEHGFVPHMTYAGDTISRGPLPHASSLTQPPVYAHAGARLSDAGFVVNPPTIAHIEHGLDWLWEERLTTEGLLRIVHPWESGADDSPRWDSWIGSSDWNRPEWTGADFTWLEGVTYDDLGAAVSSSVFEAAPAAFNAIAAHAALETARLTDDPMWNDRGVALAEAIDATLWDDASGLWSDLAIVEGGPSVHIPTLDGLLPALVTRDAGRAGAAVDQLRDPERFKAPYGVAYVARDHPVYRPDQYWRGSSWMQMNYLAMLAAARWDATDVVTDISAGVRRAAIASAFAEHWNPETGEGYGAVPQTWSALVVAFPTGPAY